VREGRLAGDPGFRRDRTNVVSINDEIAFNRGHAHHHPCYPLRTKT